MSGDVSVGGGIHGNAIALVSSVSQVGGVNQRGAGGVDLGHKGTTRTCALEGPIGRGKVGGKGSPGDVGAAGQVHSDTIALVFGTTSEIGGVSQSGAIRTELSDKSIAVAATDRLEGSGSRGEVERLGQASHIGVTGSVDRDCVAVVVAAATQISRVNQSAAVGAEFRYKSIRTNRRGEMGLNSIRCWEVWRIRRSCDIGAAGRIHGHA